MSEPFLGEIRMFAGEFAPSGWALCDGQLIAIAQNDALFSLYGTIYGGDGESTFGLPDLRGRVPIHAGTGPGLSPRQLGAKEGDERITLTTSQIPSHSHRLQASTQEANVTTAAGNVPAANSSIQIYGGTTVTKKKGAALMANDMLANTGGSQSHSNLQPTLCVNFIVALLGIYPTRQ